MAGPSRGEIARLGLAWLGTSCLAWVVMLAFWPWAFLDPLRNPVRALTKFSHFWNPDLLWEGRIVSAVDVPRSYIVKALAYGLPEFYFVAFILGAIGGVMLLRRRHTSGNGRRLLQGLWLASLPILPLAWIVVNHTPLYNGYRHVLFVIPFLAVLAALGVVCFMRTGLAWPARGLAVVVIGALALLAAVDAVQLHPYQYVYFNRLLVGGLPGAVHRFDTDYWGASYKEATEWVIDHYASQPGTEKVRVSAFAVLVPLDYYIGRSQDSGRFLEVGLGRSPHVILAPTSYRYYEQVTGRVVHVVERQGAPLLYVFEVRPPSGATAGSAHRVFD